MNLIRSRLSRFTAASALAALLVVVVAPAPSGADAVGPLLIVSVNSGKVMDIPGASHTAGTQLIQWTTNGGVNQQWTIVSFGSIGTAQLVVVVSDESGLVLDVAGGSAADGAPVVQSAWSGALSQVWWAASFSDVLGAFVNMSSGKVLDVAGSSVAEGAPLIQWSWNGGNNQIWSTLGLDGGE